MYGVSAAACGRARAGGLVPPRIPGSPRPHAKPHPTGGFFVRLKIEALQIDGLGPPGRRIQSVNLQ